MSIPEKEFLSKKKYIYEVTCFPDGRVSIERRTITYLNKSYVWALVPGNDEQLMIRFNNIHDSEDTRNIFDDMNRAKLRDFKTSSFYWDRPDILSDEYLKEAEKSYVRMKIEDVYRKIAEAKRDYDERCRTYDRLLNRYKKQLEELEEK